MDKILSVVVPSYNAAPYLLETMPSLLSIKNRELLELIIVNDGSQDNTLEVAKQLEQNYPETVKIVDKPNGGHGSTINAGSKIATGKYFKVVDADDWVDTQNFEKLIRYLQEANDDMVVSPYYDVYMDKNQEAIKHLFTGIKYRESLDYDDYLAMTETLPVMHTITIKTSILQSHNITIDEKMFYVDWEYNVYPIPYLKTISYFELPVYRYRLGSATQSVSMASYIKNRKMHENVIMSLIDFYLANEKGLTPIRKDKVFNKILELLAINTNIYLSMTNSDEAKQEFLKFERLVKDKDNAFSQQVIGKKRKLLLKFPFLFSTLSKVSRH